MRCAGCPHGRGLGLVDVYPPIYLYKAHAVNSSTAAIKKKMGVFPVDLLQGMYTAHIDLPLGQVGIKSESRAQKHPPRL